MAEENSYSKVIYREVNDRENKKIVNSLRFKNPKEKRYKDWSPEIS